MPYIDLLVHPDLTPEQATRLSRGITAAMAEVTHKRREVTAVRVTASPAHWTINGEPARRPTAFLAARITAGTNTVAEKAELVHRLHALLNETLGEIEPASYIVVHELPATDWGYAGLTQATRSGARP